MPRPQFTLRVLLVAVVFIAMVCCVAIEVRRRHQITEARKSIERVTKVLEQGKVDRRTEQVIREGIADLKKKVKRLEGH